MTPRLSEMGRFRCPRTSLLAAALLGLAVGCVKAREDPQGPDSARAGSGGGSATVGRGGGAGSAAAGSGGSFVGTTGGSGAAGNGGTSGPIDAPMGCGMPCDIPGNVCRTGILDCTGGQPQCKEYANGPNGKECGASMVCKDGECAACMTGEACVPANPCHKGTLDCAAGVKCTDTGLPAEVGATCGTGKVCNAAGSCEACAAGESCKPMDACKAGKIQCTTGAPVCVVAGDAPNGSECGAGMVCSAGACVACSNGMTCVPTNKCHTGALSCGTGAGQCMDTGNNLPNGTACGDNMVCKDGSCGSCTDIAPCIPPNEPCKLVVTSCASGSAECMVTGNAPEGRACGDQMACRGGSCVQCRNSGSCSDQPCRSGQWRCNQGQETCALTNRPNGERCGGDNACLNGNCQRCRTSGSCESDPCKDSTWQCSNGVESCRTSNRSNGTSCGGTDMKCLNGSCRRCENSGSCTGDKCQISENRCVNGVQRCTAISRVPDGQRGGCSSTQICMGGNCVEDCGRFEGMPCRPAGTDGCMQGQYICDGNTRRCQAEEPFNIGHDCGGGRTCQMVGGDVRCVSTP